MDLPPLSSPAIPGLDLELRQAHRQFVLDTLAQNHLLQALRGSWKYGDFHLHHAGGFSLSDLDLVVPGVSPTSRRMIQSKLQKDLAPFFPLKVSIHPADSLLKMNLADSFVLNIGEFIAKTRMVKTVDTSYDHTLAKISLLLLRSYPEERYPEVACRIGTPEALSALAVKLGAEAKFSSDTAGLLLKSTSAANSFALEFLERCVFEPASEDFLGSLRNRIALCSSIEPWLREYLIRKIDGAAE